MPFWLPCTVALIGGSMGLGLKGRSGVFSTPSQVPPTPGLYFSFSTTTASTMPAPLYKAPLALHQAFFLRPPHTILQPVCAIPSSNCMHNSRKPLVFSRAHKNGVHDLKKKWHWQFGEQGSLKHLRAIAKTGLTYKL